MTMNPWIPTAIVIAVQLVTAGAIYGRLAERIDGHSKRLGNLERVTGLDGSIARIKAAIAGKN